MKRWLWAGALVVVCGLIAHWPVSTKQGINYRVRTLRMPLYIKVIEFLDRDYHYRCLAREITAGVESDAARAEAILRWMRERLYAGIPTGLPVMDDHVWHIIVRGYGGDDQLVDVFTTLASYAGVEAAAVHRLRPDDGEAGIAMALVRLNGRWVPVDPYRGFWFTDERGVPADIEAIRRDPSIVARVAGSIEVGGVPYARYVEAVAPPQTGSDSLLRSGRQMPWRRFWIEVRQWCRSLGIVSVRGGAEWIARIGEGISC